MKFLICGARSGKFPIELAQTLSNDTFSVHTYDIHQARKIREDLCAVPHLATRIEVFTSAALPQNRTWDRGAFFRDDKLMPAELQLDCLQDMFDHIPSHRIEGVDKPTARKILSKHRTFEAYWQSSIPKGPQLSFVSLPGCFCHRRADMGGLALAEVSAAALPTENLSPAPNMTILDMGCGSGFVGLLVADAWRRLGGIPHLIAVDSHARAIESTTRNAANLNISCETILSDSGTPAHLNGTCDIFLGNPPYYGDWTIAECFVQTALRTLKPTGVAYFVAKSPEGLSRILTPAFKNISPIPRRGYTVFQLANN